VWHEEKGRYLFATGDHGVDPNKPFRNNYLPVQRAVARLGMDGTRVGVHTLRASAARHLFTELSNMGYDGALRRVSSLLGHKNTTTTERYLGLSLERSSRNQQFSGNRMFPSLAQPAGDVVMLPSAGHNV
jgi:integrase